MKKSKKIKVGDVVRLTIVDHCIPATLTQPQNLHFHVYGRIVRIKGDFLAIASWMEADGAIDHNSEGFEIILSAIKEVVKLS